MKIINDIFDTKEQFHNSYVAIGTFDGIHYGHQQLIEAAVEKAKENNGISVVFTFANHPMEIIDASKTPKRKDIYTGKYGDRLPHTSAF